MRVKLVTRITPGTPVEGAKHGDQLASTVNSFFKRINLDYPDAFVCIFIYGESENHNAPGPHLGYGEPYLLNPNTVVPDLVIVCTQDIQTLASNAMQRRENRNAFDGYKRRITDLRRITTVADKYLQLENILNRRDGPYVEGRMFRTLRESDVIEKL